MKLVKIMKPQEGVVYHGKKVLLEPILSTNNDGLWVHTKIGYPVSRRNGKNVTLSIAVKTQSDRIFIESIDCVSVRNGNRWILDFSDIDSIAIDGANEQNILHSQIKDLKINVKVILLRVSDIINANFKWEQGIYQRKICHHNQSSLREVVTN